MADDSSTSNLHRQAINAALKCEWEQALLSNKQILEIEPENVDCLNRLAKAHIELGEYSEAKKIYQLVLSLDAYNTIAQKNLLRISAFKKDGIKSNHTAPMSISPSFFLEEPGFTKLVVLIKLAEPQRILILSAGMMVNLVPKNRGISVTDMNNQYVGALPDDTSHHLLRLIKGGNKYTAYIKSIKASKVTILIREVFRSKKFKNQASFLDSSRPLTFSSDHLSLIANGNQDEEASDETEEIVV